MPLVGLCSIVCNVVCRRLAPLVVAPPSTQVPTHLFEPSPPRVAIIVYVVVVHGVSVVDVDVHRVVVVGCQAD